MSLINYRCSRKDNADMPVMRWKYLQKLLAEGSASRMLLFRAHYYDIQKREPSDSLFCYI